MSRRLTIARPKNYQSPISHLHSISSRHSQTRSSCPCSCSYCRYSRATRYLGCCAIQKRLEPIEGWEWGLSDLAFVVLWRLARRRRYVSLPSVDRLAPGTLECLDHLDSAAVLGCLVPPVSLDHLGQRGHAVSDPHRVHFSLDHSSRHQTVTEIASRISA